MISEAPHAAVYVRCQATMDKASLPRVLYVLNVEPATKFGSMEEQIVFLDRAFCAAGGRFVPLFTFPLKPGSTDGWRRRGIQVHCLDLSRFRLRMFAKLWRLIGREKIDVIHWNMTHPLKNAYLWGLTLLAPRIRHVYTDHNSRNEEPYEGPRGWRRVVKRLLLRRYRQVWCVSRFVQDCLAVQGTWSHLLLCHHFVNTERFRPDPAARAELRGRHGVEDRFVVALIAQLIRAKGVDVALRALALLPEKAVLWVVGAGSEAEDLKALARRLGVDRRVTFWGLQHNVEPFLQAADCLVLPSRWQEAAGMVILEAQASGLPVVASRVGGIPEHIDEGKTGYLFSAGDVHELATYLGELCDDECLRVRMGCAAKDLAHARFAPENRLPEILSLYQEVVR